MADTADDAMVSRIPAPDARCRTAVLVYAACGHGRSAVWRGVHCVRRVPRDWGVRVWRMAVGRADTSFTTATAREELPYLT